METIVSENNDFKKWKNPNWNFKKLEIALNHLIHNINVKKEAVRRKKTYFID